MKLTDVIHPKAINLELSGTTREEVLSQLVDLLAGSGAIQHPDKILDSLVEREGLGSTGIGHGVAIPHGRCAELKAPSVALGRTQKDIEFDSIDGKPARLFFLLIAPENGSSEHLHLLAKIARLMKDSATRELLFDAPTPEKMLALIEASEAG